MGPLSEESGDTVAMLDSLIQQHASMGPLSEESGDQAKGKAEARALAASMGPLSEESGDRLNLLLPQNLSRRRFNGAALRRERRRLCVAAYVQPRMVASMGPLSEESGDVYVWPLMFSREWWLQWGRSPKRAETLAASL